MNEKIGIVGLGYVGLPLAVAFAKKFKVIGFDVFEERINELKTGIDHTCEVEKEALDKTNITFTTNSEDLTDCSFIIVTVPTPITSAKTPDLSCLENASATVGHILKEGMTVVYESTVYPGVTEEVCLPILEKESGLKLGQFAIGYSPERINPGDKKHTVTQIKKIVSGNDTQALEHIASVYGSIILGGIHKASSIKTAEAAKVIENVQRDLNIALMNELSKIFSLIGLNTNEVLEAAGTKWNFHQYTPGLVGGHCIGVDPYYLTHKALELGYHPEIILSGRRINDSMGSYAGEMTVHKLVKAGILPQKAHVWVLGLTFKENVPDFRNTRALEVVKDLREHGAQVSVWEPLADAEEIQKKFGLETIDYEHINDIDAVVVINGHQIFNQIKLSELKDKMRNHVIVDLKNFFDRDEAISLGFFYQSL